MASRLHSTLSPWTSSPEEDELYSFRPNTVQAEMPSPSRSVKAIRFQQRFYVSSPEASSYESVSTGYSRSMSSSSQYTSSSDESLPSISSEETTGSSSQEESDPQSSMAQVDVLYEQDMENQMALVSSEDEGSIKRPEQKGDFLSDADSDEESEESGEEISIHSAGSDVDEVEDMKEYNEKDASLGDCQVASLEEVQAPLPVDIADKDESIAKVGSGASSTKKQATVKKLDNLKCVARPIIEEEELHSIEEEEEEEEEEDDDLSGDETDTCNLSIEEHLSRRLGKWRQYRKDALDEHAPSQNGYDDATIGTIETNRSHEKVKVAGNCPKARDPSWDRTYSTDSSVIVKIVGCEPPAPGKSTEKVQRHSRKRHYSRKSELSPVKESEISNSKHTRHQKGKLQKGPLQHVEYFAALDQASVSNDLSTVGPISKSHAQAAFLPPKEKVEVPVEIQTLILEDLQAAQNPSFDGKTLTAPPVSIDDGSAIEQHQTTKEEKAGMKAKFFRDRSDVEIFCLTLISLTLVLLLIMLVVVLVRDKK